MFNEISKLCYSHAVRSYPLGMIKNPFSLQLKLNAVICMYGFYCGTWSRFHLSLSNWLKGGFLSEARLILPEVRDDKNSYPTFFFFFFNFIPALCFICWGWWTHLFVASCFFFLKQNDQKSPCLWFVKGDFYKSKSSRRSCSAIYFAVYARVRSWSAVPVTARRHGMWWGWCHWRGSQHMRLAWKKITRGYYFCLFILPNEKKMLGKCLPC